MARKASWEARPALSSWRLVGVGDLAMLKGVFNAHRKQQLPGAGGRQQCISAAAAALAQGQHFGVCSSVLLLIPLG